MNYHQGDILLRKREKSIPQTAKKIRSEIVAFGEVTGHSHRIQGCDIFVDENEPYEMVRCNIPAPMVHDEHPQTEIVEAGDYDRLRQYEYFPEGDLEVKD